MRQLTAGFSRDVNAYQWTALLRVDPGNPDDSYLIIKLEGGDRIADGTARMPLGRTPLTPEQIAVVREWIASGAP